MDFCRGSSFGIFQKLVGTGSEPGSEPGPEPGSGIRDPGSGFRDPRSGIWDPGSDGIWWNLVESVDSGGFCGFCWILVDSGGI
jgi:hypothetical protein